MTDSRNLTQSLSGKWHGHYGTSPCPVCQPERRPDQDALTLSDRTDRTGILLHCKKSACAFVDILAAAGIAPGPWTRPDPVARLQAAHAHHAEAAKRADQALRLWQETQPIDGTHAETYLRHRGITCPLPDTLRFHPECWHGATAQRLPALVARVDGAGAFAVHRTYLCHDGSGKAAIDPPKAMLGTCAGGAVRLSQSTGSLVVCEGIETGLSLLCGLLRGPATVWAALSTSGLRGLSLPPAPGRLTIASDGDAPGREAAHALAFKAQALGWQVSMLPAPDGRDWNDVVTLNRGTA